MSRKLELDLLNDRAVARRRQAGVQVRVAFGMALVMAAFSLIGVSLLMLALG